MVGVQGVVRAYVLADAAIAALIGTRFYPVKAPQAAVYPLVTMQKIAEPRFPHLRGPGGMAAAHFQIDAWVKETGAAFTQAQVVADLIRRRIDGFTGVLTDTSESPDASFQVAIHYEDARDLFESDVAGGYYRQSTDYVIWHQPVTQ